MCHNCAKHFTLSFLLLTAGFSSFAQNSNKENTPYSRYGIGEQRNGLNVPLKAMGNISSAYANQFNVNTDNPATYSVLKYTTYEAGGEGSTRNISANNSSYTTGTASLSYITIGIPLGKYGGMALGMRPNTRVYYNMRDSTDLPGIGPAIRTYQGEGSTNYAFIGFAGAYKGLSVGVNVGYLFGTIRNSSIVQKQYDTVNSYNSDFSKYNRVGGIYWKLGLLYEAKLSKDLSLRIGGTATLSQDISAHKDDYAISWRTAGGVAIYDTAVDLQNVKGKITLPLSYSGGIQFIGTDKWMAGLDFSAAQWSQFRNFGVPDSVDNSYKIGVGGEYTPNASSLYKYLPRVTYRLGFYYGTDNIKLRDESLNFYAVTFGASLPFKRSADRLHLGFEIGKRGTEAKGLIQENFFRFSLGISLNDKWFVKRKYD